MYVRQVYPGDVDEGDSQPPVPLSVRKPGTRAPSVAWRFVLAARSSCDALEMDAYIYSAGFFAPRVPTPRFACASSYTPGDVPSLPYEPSAFAHDLA